MNRESNRMPKFHVRHWGCHAPHCRVRQSILRDTKQQENPLEQVLGSLLGGVASGMIANQTLRTDYVFLSTYETQFNQEHLRAIGVLKNFYILETPKALSKKDE